MFKQRIITIDTDWASDDAITHMAQILADNSVKATWFVTHTSKAVMNLLNYNELFEVGLHPNFLPGTTQGDTPATILGYLKTLFPKAVSVRTHALFQSTPLLNMMRRDFNLLYDVSILLPCTPNIMPHEIFYERGVSLIRIPFFWEDDIEMYNHRPIFHLSHQKYNIEGLQIFNFHPVHVALNSTSMEAYAQTKMVLPMDACTLSQLQKYGNPQGVGAGTFFKEVVECIKHSTYAPGLTISEVALKWKYNSEKL
ncbi:MAG: hypothetical protein HQL06_08950 [Nitrospirae bacterium]|nr:hypothetical protein [Nitrospirota bacterium]